MVRLNAVDTRETLRRRLWRHPRLFLAFYGARKPFRHLVVNDDTELVIEAFPRSGNTFCVVAFEHAQQRLVRIAHHMHSPVQVAEGVRRKLPSLVVVRKPLDAVTSLVIYNSGIRPLTAVKNYLAFHTQVLPLLPFIAVASFEEITTDFGRSIRRLNAKFMTHYKSFDPTEMNRRAVTQRIEALSRVLWGTLDERRVSRPSAERRVRSNALKEQMMADRMFRHTLLEAQSVYKQLVGQCPPVLSDAL